MANNKIKKQQKTNKNKQKQTKTNKNQNKTANPTFLPE